MSVIASGSEGKVQDVFNKPSISVTLQQLKSIILAAKVELKDFSDGFEYSGFDREKIGKLCGERFGAAGTAKLILIGVKRGTRLDKILNNSVRPDPEVVRWYKDGKVSAGGKGPDVVSVGRILACFPDCAVLIGKLFGVLGKFSVKDCPAELQFPAAASLPMSPQVRAAHVEFCRQFGELIKSPFNPSFYKIAFSAMIPVSQVDPRILGVLGEPEDRLSRGIDIDAYLGIGGGVPLPVKSSTPEGKRPVVSGPVLQTEHQTAPEDLSSLFESLS